jgi:hypothetical protein
MPRKGSKKAISAAEEAANAKALDKEAGIIGGYGWREEAAPLPPGKVEASAAPPLTYDTREKLLLKYAQEGFSDAFFKDFADRKELLDLTCLLGIRRMAIIVCCKDPEVADTKDAIAVMRVVLNMVYGENASMNPEKFIAPPPAAVIPVGAADGIDATMEKMKKFGAK